MTIEKNRPKTGEYTLEDLIRDLELIDHNSPHKDSDEQPQGGGPDDGDLLG